MLLLLCFNTLEDEGRTFFATLYINDKGTGLEVEVEYTLPHCVSVVRGPPVDKLVSFIKPS